MTRRQKQSKKAVAYIRKVTGLNQRQLAELIGASLNGVKGWTRNKKPSPISADYRNRIFWATGADIQPDGRVVQLANQNKDGTPFTEASFKYWREHRAIRKEKSAGEMAERCAAILRRMFFAAIPKVETQKSKLPAVVMSFNEWSQKAGQEFKLVKRYQELFDEETKQDKAATHEPKKLH